MGINYYDKLYFLLYSLLSKIGKYDLGFKAMMLLSAMIFAHVITVVFLIYEKSDLEWLASYPGVITIGLPILVFNYFYFVYSHRFRKISETMRGRKSENTILIGGIGYLVITVVLLLFVVMK